MNFKNIFIVISLCLIIIITILTNNISYKRLSEEFYIDNKEEISIDDKITEKIEKDNYDELIEQTFDELKRVGS